LRKILLIAVVCSLLFTVQAATAAPLSITEQITISQEQYNVQIVVVGDANKAFEADLELPDGTKIEHNNYDGNKYMYIEMEEGERRWLINSAAQGTYKLHIEGADQSYSISLKEELRRPNTTWRSPLNTEVVVQASSSLSLKWDVNGDVEQTDRIRFYLQSRAGGAAMLVGEEALAAGQAELTLPATIEDGQYKLSIIADNKTSEGQQIDPEVTVKLQRGYSAAPFKLLRVIPEGSAASILFEVPASLPFSGGYAWLTSDSGEEVALELMFQQLEQLEADESGEVKRYAWSISLEEGTYTGKLQLTYDDGMASSLIDIPSFTLKPRDWSKDTVVWIPEDEKIHSTHIQVQLTLASETLVQLVDSADGLLYEQQLVPAGDGVIEETITVPISEGDHIVELLLSDPAGDAISYSKRYLVDRTPPTLTMIQPQSTHAKLEGNKASGFTDTDSIVIANGQQLEPDESGYFVIDDVGEELTITVRDAHGNETYFHWKEADSGSKLWIWFVIINLLLITAAVVVIYKLRQSYHK